MAYISPSAIKLAFGFRTSCITHALHSIHILMRIQLKSGSSFVFYWAAEQLHQPQYSVSPHLTSTRDVISSVCTQKLNQLILPSSPPTDLIAHILPRFSPHSIPLFSYLTFFLLSGIHAAYVLHHILFFINGVTGPPQLIHL
ncbi:hypothetical protein PISMIDRAFT_685498, partial [Pisolithus microcarpus 441]